MWKTREDVKKLEISDVIVGNGNTTSRVYKGKIWFGPRPIKVAVKRFRSNFTDKDVARHEEVISKLTAAGVPIPKVGFVKHGGKWVQVMHLFSSRGTSKINHFPMPRDVYQLKNYVKVLSTIANAGFYPAVDSIGSINTQSGPKYLVFDLGAYASAGAHTSAVDRRLFFELIENAAINSKVPLPVLVKHLKSRITNPQIRDELTSKYIYLLD